MTDQKQQAIFDEWLHQHKGIFFKIIRSYAFTADDQDDLFQEICFQVWRSIPDFRGEAKPSTWIYRIGLFSATTWVRKEKKRPETQSLTTVAHALHIQDTPRDERLDWLYQQIAKLEPADRSICLLLLEGYSYKEIASITGLSSSHVGVKVHRIKRHLTQQSREKFDHGL